MNGFIMLAAMMLTFLDPYTSVYQTDDDQEGKALATEAGYWPVPNGLKDPLSKKPSARIIHTCFRISDKPMKGYDENRESRLFKVNQVGYLPDAPKFAYMGAWLGPNFGAWKPKSPITSWDLVDATSGQVILHKDTGALGLMPRMQDSFSKEGVPFTGENTYELDFSEVTREGEYYLRVPGIGRSQVFRIDRGAAEEAFRVHCGGLYQKRCGIAKTEPYTHWTAGKCHTNVLRGTFASDEGKLEPKTKWFEIIRSDLAGMATRRHEKLHLEGGWHDAADYDRRPMHLNIVNDLCAVYILKKENFRDGQLSIPENANGIADILDEAEWGLRELLAGQQPDGGVGTWIETTSHPVPGNIAEKDQMQYVLAKATRKSSLMYAAHAALLARCNDTFKEKYLASAIRAWDFAIRTKPRTQIYEIKYKKHKVLTETKIVRWTEGNDLPAEYLVKAAVNLHALTGDDKYLAELRKLKDNIAKDQKKNAWRWIPLLFSAEMELGTPAEMEYFFANWRKRTINLANDICRQLDNSYAYRIPWWSPQKGVVNAMSWGQSLPLRRAQFLIAAHNWTKDSKYLKAASLANDFHNGCNPQGTTLTSGLGKVYPVAFLDLPSYVDDIAEYVPGITPYRWTYGMAQKVVEMVFGGDKARANQWPIWRRWCNLENQTVEASEYTVWETIAPAASVTGYLMCPSNSKPPQQKAPAKSLTELPGYWVLP